MKRKSPIHAYKRLLAHDQDWDYAYLIALEKKKLQRMHDCIKREGHLENNAIVVRDIAICIRLIDIFMEDDAVYNTWLHQSFSGKLKFRKLENNLYELDDSDRKPIADFSVYLKSADKKSLKSKYHHRCLFCLFSLLQLLFVAWKAFYALVWT